MRIEEVISTNDLILTIYYSPFLGAINSPLWLLVANISNHQGFLSSVSRRENPDGGGGYLVAVAVFTNTTQKTFQLQIVNGFQAAYLVTPE